MQNTATGIARVVLVTALTACSGGEPEAGRTDGERPGRASAALSAAFGASSDTRLAEHWPTTLYGSAQTLQIDGDSPDASGHDSRVILKWDVSTIPAGSSVNAAIVSVHVPSDSSTLAFYAYEMKRPWTEAGATWNQYAAGASWQVPGARGANDAGGIELGTLAPASATGWISFGLNQNGVALVQAWANGAANHGVILAHDTNANGVVLSARESGNAARLQVEYTPPSSCEFVWPLSGTCDVAAPIRYPFGPRRFRSDDAYDFHAGIDFPARIGTPVYAMAEGTVHATTEADGGTAGRSVLLAHASNRWTKYLHLSDFASGIQAGVRVGRGQLIGYTGETGAKWPHLHVTYMVGSAPVNERVSRNPLELLQRRSALIGPAKFERDPGTEAEAYRARIPISVSTMYVSEIVLAGAGQVRSVRYADIVQLGDDARNAHEHGPAGAQVSLDATRPTADADGKFDLIVAPYPIDAFPLERVVLRDHLGNTVLDGSR